MRLVRSPRLGTGLVLAAFVLAGPATAADPTLSFAVLSLGQAGDGADDGRGEDTGPPPDPETFDAAYEQATFMVSQWKEDKKAADEEKDAARKVELTQAAEDVVQEALRMMTVALGNADASTPPDRIDKLRYLLCYTAYQVGRYPDAGLVGETVAGSLAKTDAKTSQGAGYIALLAYNKMLSAAPAKDRDFELDRLSAVTSILHDNFPDSAQAETARLLVAGQLFANGRPDDAAAWYAKVPAKSPKHVDAQLVGGRAAFAAYARAAVRKGENAPTAEELAAMLADAKQRLTEGVQKKEAGLKAGTVDTNLVQGKYALAQLHNRAGEYDTTLKLLVGEPFPVVPATNVGVGAKRPASGIKSRDFASSAHELLLRTYVGKGDLDEAQKVVKTLETIGGGSGSVTAVYVNLGKQLRQELTLLKAEGDTERITSFVSSFDALLTKLVEQSATLDAGSLEFVATTYAALAASIDDETQKSTYYSKSAKVYETVVEKAPPERLVTIQLERAQILRAAGEYDDALEAVAAVLKQKPTSLDGQVAAASILAESGTDPVDPKKLGEALSGTSRGGATIWGWAGIERRLGRLVSSGDPSDYVLGKYFDARYNVAAVSREIAVAGGEKSRLGAVLGYVTRIARSSAELSDEQWDQLDELYQKVQEDLGRPPTPLERPESATTETSTEE